MGSEIELTVTFTYWGPKARIDTPEDAVRVIREDLTALGIPHPKRCNVSVVYPGTVRFFWIAAPMSVIHKNLISGIRPVHDTQERQRILKDRFIKRMDLKESEPVHTNGLSNSNFPPTFFKPCSYPGTPDASLSAIPMSGYSHTLPPPRPPPADPPDSGTFEILGSISSTAAFPPQTIKVKTEPVADVPIPPAPPWGYQPAGKLEHGAAELPPVAWIKPGTKGALDRGRHNLHGMDEDREGDRSRRFSTHGSINRYYDADEERDGDRPRRPSTHERYKQAYRPPPLEPSMEEKAELRHELLKVRRQLRADIAHERVIMQRLRDLGEEQDAMEAYSDDFVTRARIQQIEDELQEEQARRRQLEEIVADIRRECTTPFVVPALLDAFMEISKLTNEAMEEG